MTLKKALIFFAIVLLLGACAKEQDKPPSVTVKVTGHKGKALPIFSLQLIEAGQGWTGIPYEAKQNKGKKLISASLPTDLPVVLRLGAPGYQPLFTFLKPTDKPVEMSVKLGSPTLVPDSKPLVVGDFNNFDSGTGIEMKQQDDGSWTADVETKKDSIHYAIGRYVFGGKTAGTEGEFVLQDSSRGVQPSFINAVIKSPDQSIFQIRFDPSVYSDILESAEPEITFSENIPDDVAGIAQVYTLMIEEYWAALTSRSLARTKADKKTPPHNFASSLTKLEKIKHEYPDSSVTSAVRLAKLFLLDSSEISKSDVDSFLGSLSPDSPIWMMNYPALTKAVNRLGLENAINKITEIAAKTPYETLRGEALYNLVRYYYEEQNEEKWYATFTELVSNHPDHYRTTYAYKNYAPAQPISEGKELLYNRFGSLKSEKSLDLKELKESYLLLDFWATWCSPCIEEIPNLQKVNKQFSSFDFAIVSISTDDDPGRVATFRENELAMPWYHAYEKRGSKKIREMGIVGIPHYILLGPDRKVLLNDQSLLRGDSLQITLKKYLEK